MTRPGWNLPHSHSLMSKGKPAMREDVRRLEDNELREIVEQKISALICEMQNANWNAVDVAEAIQQVVEDKWLKDAAALRTARGSTSTAFVSDGNEG